MVHGIYKPLRSRKGKKILYLLLALVLVLAGAFLLRYWIEAQIKKQLEEKLREYEKIGLIRPKSPIGQIGQIGPIGPIAQIGPSEDLTRSSFTDLFTSDAWLQKEKTVIHHDRTTTAFTFPPKFSWQKINPMSPIGPIGLGPIGASRRCLKDRCLVQENQTLFLETQSYEVSPRKIGLPEELQGKSLVNLSIANLETVWLLGAVMEESDDSSSRSNKTDKTYKGAVFVFDGDKFIKIIGVEDDKFLSQYPGTLGFGGSDNDWLAIYGGIEGIAYRIKGSIANPEISDVSRFFGLRVMAKGFHPEVIKIGSGKDTHWYVYSLTEGKPKLTKLFQNKTDEIAGAVDFSEALFAEGTKRAVFKLAGDEEKSPLSNWRKTLTAALGFRPSRKEPRLGASVIKSGGEEAWEFADQGFDKSRTVEVVSSNLNNYSAEVRRAVITEIDLSEGGTAVEFALSNNGEKWYKAEVGKVIEFPKGSGQELRWRAQFTPSKDSDTSFFFDRVRIDFWAKFL